MVAILVGRIIAVATIVIIFVIMAIAILSFIIVVLMAITIIASSYVGYYEVHPMHWSIP